MFLALHGPLKTTGLTRNLSLGTIIAVFSASEQLHAAFQVFKNACKLLFKLIFK